jgi:hypothetical protein
LFYPTEYEVFYLLVKLSYTESYTVDGRRELEPGKLLQMLGTAKAFGFTDAAAACTSVLVDNMEQLAEQLTLKSALHFLKAREALNGHNGHRNVQDRAEVLLAEHVGPLSESFQTPDQGRVAERFPLVNKVKVRGE